MRARYDAPEVFRFQVRIIPVLYKQSIDRIPFLESDLDIIIFFGRFLVEELFDIFYIHRSVFYEMNSGAPSFAGKWRGPVFPFFAMASVDLSLSWFKKAGQRKTRERRDKKTGTTVQRNPSNIGLITFMANIPAFVIVLAFATERKFIFTGLFEPRISNR